MDVPAEHKGEFVEDSFCAHQVPVPDAKTDIEGLKTIQEWFLSYNHIELFTEKGSPIDEVLPVVPRDN